MTEFRGFKFKATLVSMLKKIESKNETKNKIFYPYSKEKITINEKDINDTVFKSMYTTVISNIQKVLGKGSGWIIGSVIEHNINISKYDLLAGSSYIKLSNELDHPRKLIH